MISFDTNLLLYSLNQDCPEYNDAQLALTLRGVSELATHNGTHFAGFGFTRLWNLLPASSPSYQQK